MRPTVHIVLPAFNEEEALPSQLERLRGLAEAASGGNDARYELRAWVVDDGSADDTAGVARRDWGALRTTLVRHARNAGLGAALNTGLRSALSEAADHDLIVVMDADDTHDVDLIGPMFDEVQQGADVVIASRYVPGGDDSTAPAFRRLLSRGAATVFRAMFPLDGFADFTSGFRAYRAGLLRAATAHYGERLIEEQGFACMVELLLKLRHWNPRIAEVPLVLRYDRKQGASKLRIARTIRQYLALAARDRLMAAPNVPALVTPRAQEVVG